MKQPISKKRKLLSSFAILCMAASPAFGVPDPNGSNNTIGTAVQLVTERGEFVATPYWHPADNMATGDVDWYCIENAYGYGSITVQVEFNGFGGERVRVEIFDTNGTTLITSGECNAGNGWQLPLLIQNAMAGPDVLWPDRSKGFYYVKVTAIGTVGEDMCQLGYGGAGGHAEKETEAMNVYNYVAPRSGTQLALAYWFLIQADAKKRRGDSRGEADAIYRYWEYVAYFYYTTPTLPSNEQLYFFYLMFANAEREWRTAVGDTAGAVAYYNFYLNYADLALAGLIRK